MTFEKIYAQAKAGTFTLKLSNWAEAGGVCSVIITEQGNIYQGVCIDTSSGMGFCAEHAAAAAMINAGEHHIKKIIAVGWDGSIYPPCGRCREFLSQIHPENKNTEVMVAPDTILRLKDLLPYDWKDIADK